MVEGTGRAWEEISHSFSYKYFMKQVYKAGRYFYYWQGKLAEVDLSLDGDFWIYKCSKENFRTNRIEAISHLKSTKKEALKDYIKWQRVNIYGEFKYVAAMFKNVGYIFRAIGNYVYGEIKDRI